MEFSRKDIVVDAADEVSSEDGDGDDVVMPEVKRRRMNPNWLMFLFSERKLQAEVRLGGARCWVWLLPLCPCGARRLSKLSGRIRCYH